MSATQSRFGRSAVNCPSTSLGGTEVHGHPLQPQLAVPVKRAPKWTEEDDAVAAYRRCGAWAGTGPWGPGGEAFWPRP